MLTATEVGVAVVGSGPVVSDVNASLLVGFEQAVGKKALTCVHATLPSFDVAVTPSTAEFLKNLAGTWSELSPEEPDEMSQDAHAFTTNLPR